MAKNQNGAEKRRREVEKKFKAEEKRKNRQKKKTVGSEPLYPPRRIDADVDATADSPADPQ